MRLVVWAAFDWREAQPPKLLLQDIELMCGNVFGSYRVSRLVSGFQDVNASSSNCYIATPKPPTDTNDDGQVCYVQHAAFSKVTNNEPSMFGGINKCQRDPDVQNNFILYE